MDQSIALMIEEFSNHFVELIVQNPSKQFYSKDERIEFHIHYNFWKRDILKALNGHCFDTHPLSPDKLSNWILRYAHALCEYALLDRPTLELIHKLDLFPPRSSFFETIPQKKKIHFDLYNTFLSKTGIDAIDIHNNFNVILEIEDVEVLREFARLIQFGVNLKKGNKLGSYSVYLKKEELDKIKETVTQGVDKVIVVEKSKEDKCSLLGLLISDKDSEGNKLPIGQIKKFHSTHIEISVFDEIIDKKSCLVAFQPLRILLRYQLNALQLLHRCAATRKYLFPKLNSQLKFEYKELTLELINSAIAKNPEQLAAVTNIVNGPNPHAPYIIFGPPGTGKTTTIVEAMLQLRLQNPKSRILVASGSNAACDTIAVRLCEIFDNNIKIQEELVKHNVFPMLRIYSRSVMECGTLNILNNLRRRSNLEWVNGKFGEPSFKYIHRYGIVVATLCTVGKLVCGDVGKVEKRDESQSNHFTHVFIDEAAASSEPEALIGIMGIKNGVHDQSCRIILSGDHKQLGPVIKSDEAKNLGLGKSLMERLLESECYALNGKGDYDHSLQIRLRQNYRSHPEIVRLYNHLFYNNELIPMNKQAVNESRNWSFLPNSEFPIAFQVVRGVMAKKKTGSSCNMLEIKVLCSYIRQLLEADQVQQTDIGVITPYKLQCELIKDRFKELKWKNIEVGSVENYQGREKVIIIVSMVRSNLSLGFVRCPRRLNVLLSRAKSLLLILGDPTTLSGSSDLKFIINECKIKENYLEENKMIPEKNDTTKPFNSKGGIPKVKKKISSTPKKDTSSKKMNEEVKVKASVGVKTKTSNPARNFVRAARRIAKKSVKDRANGKISNTNLI